MTKMKSKFTVLFLAAITLVVVSCAQDGGVRESAPTVDVGDVAEIMAVPPAMAEAELSWDDALDFEEADWDTADDIWFEPVPAHAREAAEPAEGDGAGGVEPTAWETPEIPQPPAQRRVIRNSDIAVETLLFDETISNLERIVATNGGFVETSSQRLVARGDSELWMAEFTIRVPVDRFDYANQNLSGLGQVTRFTTNSEDVTMLFLDLQSRLAIREEEERRVEAMLNAATNLQDVLALERQLSDLRVVVDRYRRRMTEIDRLASFSTIRLSIREVVEIIEYEDEYIPYVPSYVPEEPPIDDGFGSRIAAAFGSSLGFSIFLFEAVAMVFVSLLPPAAFLAIPALGVFILVKRLRASVQ